MSDSILILPLHYDLLQLVELAKKVFHSPNLRDELRLCCEKVGIKPKQLKRSVATRWNTLAEVIERALYLRPAIDKFVLLSKFEKMGQRGPRRYQLSPSEWDILIQLEDMLSVSLLCSNSITTVVC